MCVLVYKILFLESDQFNYWIKKVIFDFDNPSREGKRLSFCDFFEGELIR